MAIKGTILFCDDVREEVGNKSSYMGIYGPHLLSTEQRGRLTVCIIIDVEDRDYVDAKISLTSNPTIELPAEFEQRIESPTPWERRWEVKMHLILQGVTLKPGLTITAEVVASGERFQKAIEVREIPNAPNVNVLA